MKKIYFLFFFSMTLFYGCREVTTHVDGSTIPEGAYYLEAFNTSRKMIVYGWFEMNIQSERIIGKWKFKEIISSGAPGIFIGDGNLEGIKDGREIRINLNPNMVDNNLNLKGSMDGDIITGTWTYDGFAPNLASGTFRAVKNN